MARVEQSIDVNLPLSAVYNQWTQFEQFPRFMEGVREVKQLDDAHLHWRAERHGRVVEWESEIVEQVPDKLMSWRDTSGPHHSGSIRFESLGEGRSRVMMSLEFDPSHAAASFTASDLAERVGQDLERFKQMVEGQGHESGAWRGEIHQARSMGSGSATGATANATGDATAGAGERTVGQTASEAREGASSSAASSASSSASSSAASGHPRWEGWDDESAFGTNTASGDMPGGPEGNRGRSAGGQESAWAGGGRGQGRDAGRDAGRNNGREQGKFGRGSAQDWLRNQFPNLNEPIGVMRRMTEEMDQIFERFVGRPIAARFGQGQGGQAGKWMPQVEVIQQEEALLVCVDLPGIKREDVNVEVLHDRLVIEGERHEERESRGGTPREGWRRSERCYGRFYRMIPLPHGVDPDQAKARLQDGVLEVRIPMPSAARAARKVDIG